MPDNIREALMVVAVIALTCLIIGIGYSMFTSASEGANEGQKQINELNKTMAESKYTNYDGETVIGSEVISAIKSFKNDSISIKVDNGYTVTEYIKKYSSSGFSDTADTYTNMLKDATDKLNLTTTYINPSSNYYAYLVYDANNTVITQIVFELTN